MDGARLEEERAAYLCGFGGRGGLELTAVGQKLDEAAQDFVVRPRPDVLPQRLFERRARAALVLGEERDQVLCFAQVLLVLHIEVARFDLIAALPAQGKVCGQHLFKSAKALPPRGPARGTVRPRRAASRCAPRSCPA